jgi:hypothetical protein
VATGFSDQVAAQSEALKKEELLSRANIIEKAAEVVFNPVETGYITTKEGAGSGGDTIFDGMPFSSKLP